MFTKKLVTISLFIFWAAVAAILTAGLVFYNEPPATSKKNPETNLNTIGEELTLTVEEAAKHNSAPDCWLIIQNKIYDISSYINLHPGNPETIIPYCGKEATAAFETKDGNKPHSQKARNLLEQYYIGDLNKQLSGQNLQESSQKIQSQGINLLTKKSWKSFPAGRLGKSNQKKTAVMTLMF